MCKCPRSYKVVLGNGDDFKFWKDKTDVHFFYQDNWRYNSDCFNWFRENFQKGDDLFLMDDDIYLSGDTAAEFSEWLSKGFDRVFYTRAYLFDVRAGETSVVNWPARSIGGCWAMSRYLWRSFPWPDRPVDAMLRYFRDLPEHNVKMIPYPKITHLIHDENVILKRSVRQNFDLENNPKLENEILKYGLK